MAKYACYLNLRKDTYNSKLFKYLVEVDEDDEEIDEDVELERKESTKAMFFHTQWVSCC